MTSRQTPPASRFDHDAHAWGDDAGVDPDDLSAARPLVWLCVACALVAACWAVSGWLA